MQKRSEMCSNLAVSFLAWMEMDSRPRLIVDDSLFIHWTNTAAKLHLRGREFSISARRVSLRDNDSTAVFQSFVRSSASDTVSMICLPYPPREHIVCAAVNLYDENGERMTGLTLRRTVSPPHVDSRPLQAAFHLTLAERRVIEKLFSGQTAEEAGDELCISLGTVRQHIRHIYDKLDVGSREALFGKILPYLLPPDF